MPAFRQHLLEHHLSDVTRAARRNLLFLSVIAYLFVRGQLVPDKIDFLGISFGALQQATLMKALLALLVYYFAKFYLYMFTDGEVHLYKAYTSLLGKEEIGSWQQYQAAVKAKQKEAFKHVGGWGFALLIARVVFDTFLPVLVGGYAILLVWHVVYPT